MWNFSYIILFVREFELLISDRVRSSPSAGLRDMERRRNKEPSSSVNDVSSIKPKPVCFFLSIHIYSQFCTIGSIAIATLNLSKDHVSFRSWMVYRVSYYAFVRPFKLGLNTRLYSRTGFQFVVWIEYKERVPLRCAHVRNWHGSSSIAINFRRNSVAVAVEL